MPDSSIADRIQRLHAPGLIDMHYDLLMDLFEKRDRADVLEADYLADFQAGGIGVVGAAIYLEDKYLPEMGLRVALDQISLLQAAVARSPAFAICRTYPEIVAARAGGQIALIITMEGVEPLGSDLHLLRIFHALGLRALGLTHARRNAAAEGGVFAPSGSSPHGLTAFGRALVAECEALGIILDLAHINPAGFDEIVALTTKPLIVSHTNARHYYDIERNISDDQIRKIGQRGGVIGINAVLVSPNASDSHLDRYIDHIVHVRDLIGIDGVGIGFDFFEAIFRAMPAAEQAKLSASLAQIHFLPDLTSHAQAHNLTARLIERGFTDADIAKILYGNWQRILGQLL
jgi:membrane dipeptidase